MFPKKIAIRRNTEGGYKARLCITPGKKFSSARMQFGLMTRDIKIALPRTKTLWRALFRAGYWQNSTAICMYGETTPSLEIRWIEDEPAADLDGREYSCQFGIDEMLAGLPKHILFIDKNGDYSVCLPVIDSRFKAQKIVYVPLETSDETEAKSRKFIISRTIKTISDKYIS